MKHFILSMAILVCIYSNATIRTVSNNPATIAQYNTIQGAVDASVSGDSIYVHSSPDIYAAFTITNKRLIIIGPGWSPNKDLGFDAEVNGCTITGTTCSNTEIQGMVFVGAVAINTNHPDNLHFIRNRIYQTFLQLLEASVAYTGYVFEGNWFDNSQVKASITSTYQNLVFQNNYFYESANVVQGNFDGFTNSTNVLLNHNLWFGPNGTPRRCFNENCRFLTITNNIFVERDASIDNGFSTFNNNITFNAGNNTPWASNSNIDGGGNVANQDPQMVDQASVNTGTNNPLLNFTIAAGFANNSGSDGKDMGLLYDASGSLNWTTSRASRLPYIFSMNITNPSISAGGTLNVQVQGRKNN
jgi:hypothetical protein